MPESKHYKSYTAASQHIAKVHQITIVYDGIIRHLHQAKTAIAEKKVEERYLALTKAGDIILGLQTALDFENGGTVAGLLYEFYSSIDRQIAALHRNHSVVLCDQIIAEMIKMRDAWHELDKPGSAKTPSMPGATAVVTTGAVTSRADAEIKPETIILSA